MLWLYRNLESSVEGEDDGEVEIDISSSAVNKEVDESSYEETNRNKSNSPINIQDYGALQRKGHFDANMDSEAYFEENYLKMLDKHKNIILNDINNVVDSILTEYEGRPFLRAN